MLSLSGCCRFHFDPLLVLCYFCLALLTDCYVLSLFSSSTHPTTHRQSVSRRDVALKTTHPSDTDFSRARTRLTLPFLSVLALHDSIAALHHRPIRHNSVARPMRRVAFPCPTTRPLCVASAGLRQWALPALHWRLAVLAVWDIRQLPRHTCGCNNRYGLGFDEALRGKNQWRCICI